MLIARKLVLVSTSVSRVSSAATWRVLKAVILRVLRDSTWLVVKASICAVCKATN